MPGKPRLEFRRGQGVERSGGDLRTHLSRFARASRGQAAIEQLSTYGWSLLTVLAVIGAITYFSILDPERFIPESCTFPSGIYCMDYVAATDGITVVIQNSLGFNIINLSLSLNATACVASAVGPASLTNGAQGTYVFVCSPNRGTFQGVIGLNYSSQPTLRNHYKQGYLSTRIT
jgi:hypothetical protein